MQIVQSFSRNLADKETTKEINKEIDRKVTIPRPPTGGGVIKTFNKLLCQRTHCKLIQIYSQCFSETVAYFFYFISQYGLLGCA